MTLQAGGVVEEEAEGSGREEGRVVGGRGWRGDRGGIEQRMGMVANEAPMVLLGVVVLELQKPVLKYSGRDTFVTRQVCMN